MNLEELLYPISISHFFDLYWARKAIVINGDKTKFSKLFSWVKFNDLLNNCGNSYPYLRIVDNTTIIHEDLILDKKILAEKFIRKVDPAKVINYCEKGATLVFDKSELFDKDIKNLIEELSFELGEKIQVNLYCSWSGYQGFDIHYDTHEVILLQVEGCKKWKVYDEIRKYPLDYQIEDPVKPATGAVPYLDLELTAGDLLYIPRGHYHCGIAGQDPSIHLTLGINCRTGISFAKWLADHLTENELWRKNAPLFLSGHLDYNSVKNNVTTWISELALNLSEEISKNKDVLVDAFIESSMSKNRDLNPYNLPFHGVEFSTKISYHTTFMRPKSQKILIKNSTHDTFEVVINSKRLELDIRLKTWMYHLSQNFEFTGKDAANWDSTLTWENLEKVLKLLQYNRILKMQETRIV